MRTASGFTILLYSSPGKQPISNIVKRFLWYMHKVIHSDVVARFQWFEWLHFRRRERLRSHRINVMQSNRTAPVVCKWWLSSGWMLSWLCVHSCKCFGCSKGRYLSVHPLSLITLIDPDVPFRSCSEICFLSQPDGHRWNILGSSTASGSDCHKLSQFGLILYSYFGLYLNGR